MLVADGVCVQSIEHPGCVWDAKFLENGDIVTACSDGVVRIWTVDQNKIADSVELDSYASLLSQYKISRYCWVQSFYFHMVNEYKFILLFMLFNLNNATDNYYAFATVFF